MFRLSSYRSILAVLAVLLVVLTAGTAAACPGCKDAVAANDPQHAGLVKGYFYSILLMMGTPFVMLGCFSLYMYREVQKARAREALKGRLPDARPPGEIEAACAPPARKPQREPVEV